MFKQLSECQRLADLACRLLGNLTFIIVFIGAVRRDQLVTNADVIGKSSAYRWGITVRGAESLMRYHSPI